MTILDIYQKYQIMPTLQQHQLRVAAVASILTDHITIDTKNVITACLLHDMGNILKFDLDKPWFPDFLEPEGPAYWINVQKTFQNKYGDNEHQASITIAQEVGANQRVIELIDCVSFSQAEKNVTTTDFGKKICEYSDMRVTPHGVTSLETRLKDLQKRYAPIRNSEKDKQRRTRFSQLSQQIEEQLFQEIELLPQQITDTSIQPIVPQLKQFSL